jgi:hypothetical protein
MKTNMTKSKIKEEGFSLLILLSQGYRNNEIMLFDLQSSVSESAYSQFRNYIVIIKTEIDKNWNYYSKGWHRNHGPKITVIRRCIELIHKSGKTKIVIEVDSFRGLWLLNAIAKYFRLSDEEKVLFIENEAKRNQLVRLIKLKRLNHEG